MTRVRTTVLAASLAALGGALPAQPPVTLHEAWLVEVLDLDVPRAIDGYRQVATSPLPGHPQRWVAAARLAELHRLQVDGAVLPELGELPVGLRPLFQAATELPAPDLLARTRGEPKAVLQALGSEAGRLPALRTVVPGTVDWVMAQSGPSLRDRWRQRMAAFANRNRGDAGTQTERIYANDVARAELEGRRQQADALRALYFGDWRPPAATGDATTALSQVRTRLAAMRTAEDLSPNQAALLRDLADAIEQRAIPEPEAALEFVRRLPVYAERLLGDATSGR